MNIFVNYVKNNNIRYTNILKPIIILIYLNRHQTIFYFKQIYTISQNLNFTLNYYNQNVHSILASIPLIKQQSLSINNFIYIPLIKQLGFHLYPYKGGINYN